MAEFAQREAAGVNVWTTDFTLEARTRLEAVLETWLGPNKVNASQRAERLDKHLRLKGERLIGSGNLMGRITKTIREGPSSIIPSVMDAAMAVFPSGAVISLVKDVFEEERLAFRLVNLQLVPLDSLELHEAVVAPTLRLLAGRPELEHVEEGYQSALKEIGANPADAITDAARALQAMLTAIGCEGNSIGAQLTFARRKGIFANHDATLGGGIEKIIHWVNADRSEKGDAHQYANVTAEDAWFAVHVVGALIVRISEGPRV